jgi:uncharacterized membrane protein YkoI
MLLYLTTVIVAALLGSSVAAWSQAEPERVCFTAAETREKILAHGLFEPFHVMRSAASRLQAEAIVVKLCRLRGELVYELSLLRHDGRVIRLSIDAKTGQLISSKTEH